MGTEENKAVVRRWTHELLLDGKLEIADEVLAPDYVNLAMGEPIARAPRRWSLPATRP
jgi:hypothetical protein